MRTEDSQFFSLIELGCQAGAHADETLYMQVAERIAAMIMQGSLPEGLRLPSSRSLASDLGISRKSVLRAYEVLLNRGYLECR